MDIQLIVVTTILVASIILWVIGYNTDITTMEAIGAFFTILSGIAVTIVIFMIVLEHCAISQTVIQNQIEHDSIVKEIEALERDTDEKVSRVTVIKDVQEWNSAVYSQKYWSESPWTNWFYSKEVVDSLEYIEMEE